MNRRQLIYIGLSKRSGAYYTPSAYDRRRTSQSRQRTTQSRTDSSAIINSHGHMMLMGGTLKAREMPMSKIWRWNLSTQDTKAHWVPVRIQWTLTTTQTYTDLRHKWCQPCTSRMRRHEVNVSLEWLSMLIRPCHNAHDSMEIWHRPVCSTCRCTRDDTLSLGNLHDYHRCSQFVQAHMVPGLQGTLERRDAP